MRLFASKKRWAALLTALSAAIVVTADPALRNLDIEVDLRDNGDAEIVETRQMSIDNVGTECYIVIGHLNGQTITDFYVTDETGLRYENVGEWDVDRSRNWKAGKCGIVRKKDGYELCWGLGKPGIRVYVAHYVVTKLVRSYEESDGFNWMFVARDLSPSPQRVNVQIGASCRESGLPADSISIWSFGHKGGTIHKIDSMVVATKVSMTPEESIIVLMEMKKGLLHPAISEAKSFKDVRKTAFEGSDYKEMTWWRKAGAYIWENLEVLFFLLSLLFIVVFSIIYGIQKYIERRKLLKTVNWYRQIPANGNLQRARDLMAAYYATSPISNEDLVSAMVLRLIRTKALRIEDHFVEASGLKKIFGGEGKVQQCIVIGDYDPSNRLVSTSAIRQLFDMFKQSAGDDGILQPNELKSWMRKHEDEVMKFIKTCNTKVSMKEAKKHIDDVRQVFGLKKFLEDFTLASERSINELDLWNDYLIYATLFGIADQLKEDMAKLNPEYLKMNEIARNLTNETVVPALMYSTFHSAKSVSDSVNSRHSGGGGSSSFGGGGGFSGGGSGGGVR